MFLLRQNLSYVSSKKSFDWIATLMMTKASRAVAYGTCGLEPPKPSLVMERTVVTPRPHLK